jgi:hypothetical protein
MIIHLFKKFFSKKTRKRKRLLKKIITNELNEYSTYISPWYFMGNTPYLHQDLYWKKIQQLNGEYVTLTGLFLKGLSLKNTCYGLIGLHCCVKPLENGQFLIWHMNTQKIELFDVSKLKPIRTSKINWDKLKKPYFFNSKPRSSFEFKIDPKQTESEFEFPNTVKHIEEIIQVSNVKGIYSERTMRSTAVIVLKPKENRIEIYPQDWFNKDKNIDFGYQWITRAERIKGTDKIKIQGIRIGEYELDETKREIIKSTTGNNV